MQEDYEFVQDDIAAVEKWSKENQLTLNALKCKI